MPTGTVLFTGKAMTLPVVVLDQNKVPMPVSPSQVVWTSSAPLIATVASSGNPDGSGLVTGVSEGDVEISASIIGGTRAISTPPVSIHVVTQIPTSADLVLPEPPPPVEVKPTPPPTPTPPLPKPAP